MPKINRQKISYVPLPSFLPILPTRFTDTALERYHQTQAEEQDAGTSARVGEKEVVPIAAYGKTRVRLHPRPKEHVNGNVIPPEPTLDSTVNGMEVDEMQETEREVVLPEPSEVEVMDFFLPAHNQGLEGQINGHGKQVGYGIGKDPNATYREPEAWVIKQTGEIFLDYE